MVAGGPSIDCIACIAKDPLPGEDPADPLPPNPTELPCRMLLNGELGPVRTESGLAGALLDDDDASSSSPKKLLMADMAGLKPAMASGVSRSEGINGAEKSRPRLSGFDSRPDAKLACLSMLPSELEADCFLTKNGA